MPKSNPFKKILGDTLVPEDLKEDILQAVQDIIAATDSEQQDETPGEV